VAEAESIPLAPESDAQSESFAATLLAAAPVAYDSSLLERARTQWQFCDWQSLVQLNRDTLQHHPDRAKLILLAAAGRLQTGQDVEAKQYIRLAQDWGVSKKLISHILITGVYNCLKRAAAISNQQHCAQKYFENTIEQFGKSTAVNFCTTKNVFKYAKLSNEALLNNKKHQFAASHALCHYPTGAIYSYIPKNGCTSLRYSLAIANGCISGPEELEWIHLNNDSFKATLSELIRSPYSFVVLRCPFTRLASVYLDKVVNERISLKSLDIYKLSGKPIDEVSFRDFVWLLKQDDALYGNHHWIPQVDFLVYENYSDWFRIECFGDLSSRLTLKLGVKIYDTRNLAKHGTDQYRQVSGQYSDISASVIKEMQSNGISPSHRSLYDEELLSQVSSLYKEDINIYRSVFGNGALEMDSVVFNRCIP